MRERKREREGEGEFFSRARQKQIFKQITQDFIRIRARVMIPTNWKNRTAQKKALTHTPILWSNIIFACALHTKWQ